jgi:hypothetical protein
VTDPVPSGLTIQLPVTVPNWDCSTSTTTLLTCNYIGSYPLIAGWVDNIKFNVQVSPKLIGKVENCAKVNIANDVDYGNNKNCHTAIVKQPLVSAEAAAALEQAQTDLETQLEALGDEAAVEETLKVKLQDFMVSKVALGNGFKWDFRRTDRLMNAVDITNDDGSETHTIVIHCVITLNPFSIRCTIYLENKNTESMRSAAIEGMAQLEAYLESLKDEVLAREKATSGLKDTLKSQVRLAGGTTLTPLNEAIQNEFLLGQDGVSDNLRIRIDCYFDFPPLKAGCKITILD